MPLPARPASSRRPGVTVNAADAGLALATAYVGMWGDLESARRGVGHGRPPAGHARDAGERQSRREAWCAKVLPKQDKQTR